MDQEEIIEEFEIVGALRRGHFVLASGRHSADFISKDMVTTSPSVLMELAEGAFLGRPAYSLIARVVAAPAVGAIAFGFAVASALNIQFIYAEAVSKTEVEFKRGFAKLIQPGTRVLIVEDIITTGKMVQQMIQAVEKLGGKVVGIVLLWLRGETDLGDYPVYPLVDKKLPDWLEEDCTLCLEGVPITTEYNNHGLEFLEKHSYNPEFWPARHNLS